MRRKTRRIIATILCLIVLVALIFSLAFLLYGITMPDSYYGI